MSYIFVMVIFSWAGGLQHQVLTSAESLIEDGDSSVAVGIVQMRRKAALHSIKKLMKRGIKLPKDYTMEIGFTNTPITMDSMAISELMKELVKISHVLTDGVEDALGDDPPSSVVALWTAVEYVVGKLKEYFPACDAHSLTEVLGCLVRLDSSRPMCYPPLGPRVARLACSCVEGVLGSLSARDLGRSLWAMAHLQITRVSTLKKIANRGVELCDSMSGTDVATISWSMARLGMLETKLMRVLYKRCMGRINATKSSLLTRMSPSQVAQMIWSSAQLSIKSHMLTDSFLNRAKGLVRKMGPASIANVLWSLTKLRIHAPDMVSALAERAKTVMIGMEFDDTKKLMWAFHEVPNFSGYGNMSVVKYENGSYGSISKIGLDEDLDVSVPEITILYQDDHYILVNKPSGIGMYDTGSKGKVDVLKRLHRQLGKPVFGIHHVDAQASGVVMLAKSESAAHTATQMLDTTSMNMTSIALVKGTMIPEMGVVECPVWKASEQSYVEGQLAYRVIARKTLSGEDARAAGAEGKGNVEVSLLEIESLTDEPNQIRAQLEIIGNPVLPTTLRMERLSEAEVESRKGILRKRTSSELDEDSVMMLHRTSISFLHPFRGKTICAFGRFNTEMEGTLARLGLTQFVRHLFTLHGQRNPVSGRLIKAGLRLKLIRFRLSHPFFNIYGLPKTSMQKKQSELTMTSLHRKYRQLQNAAGLTNMERVSFSMFDMEYAKLEHGIHTGEWIPCRVERELADGYYDLLLENMQFLSHIHPRYVRSRHPPDSKSRKPSARSHAREKIVQLDVYGKPVRPDAQKVHRKLGEHLLQDPKELRRIKPTPVSFDSDSITRKDKDHLQIVELVGQTIGGAGLP